jgi:hypothetical protein
MPGENPYAPTHAPLEDQTTGADARPSAGTRFLWTATIGFFFYLLFCLVLPRDRWLMGALGSAIMAAITGVIAICIPVKHKAGFIVPSILAGLVVLYLVGRFTARASGVE